MTTFANRASLVLVVGLLILGLWMVFSGLTPTTRVDSPVQHFKVVTHDPTERSV